MNAAFTPRPLLSLDEALERLLGAIAPVLADAPESVATTESLGRVLAEDVVSGVDVPPADNSAMDGYAVRLSDLGPGVVLPVSQRIPAGTVPEPLEPGTAARIFTGGQTPPGTEAVVMQEQCTVEEAGVRIDTAPRPGQNVRLRGEDVHVGAIVLNRGIRLTPQAMGVAASVGADHLKVARRPRVALFSTGDELMMPGEPLRPGAIYNSNRYTLRGLIEALGCECHDLGIVPDKLDATRAALRQAAQDADLIITSGGVSMGEEDHLKPALTAEGRLDLWQISMKPGKPLAFGQVDRAGAAPVPFIGLPGNPVSSFVTFLLAVRPVLLKLQGAFELTPRRLWLRADFDWSKADRRREFLRVKHNDDGGLDLFKNQGSGVLTSAVWGDGLVDNPGGQTIKRGDLVRFMPFSELLS